MVYWKFQWDKNHYSVILLKQPQDTSNYLILH